MSNKEFLEQRIAKRKAMLSAIDDALLALISGNAKKYKIGDREVTHLDIDKLKDEMKALEEEITELESELNGNGRRAAVGVIPRDW